MNYACDLDIFCEWARAVCYQSFDAAITRNYNVATIYKRAKGHGTITRYQNYDPLIAKYRPFIVEDTLLPIGSRRRNWRQTLVSDGYIMLRHPDLNATMEMADAFASQLNLYAE